MVIIESISQPFLFKLPHSKATLARSARFLLRGLKDFSREPENHSLSILCSNLACIPVRVIWKYYLNDNNVLTSFLFFSLFSHLVKPCLASSWGNGGWILSVRKNNEYLNSAEKVKYTRTTQLVCQDAYLSITLDCQLPTQSKLSYTLHVTYTLLY